MNTSQLVKNTKEFVRMTQSSFVSGNQFLSFLESIHQPVKHNLSMQIYALHQLVELGRSLPEKFYPNEKIREQFITSAQKKLDELILKEEDIAAEQQMQSI